MEQINARLPAPRMPSAELKRARIVYRATKWTAYLLFLLLLVTADAEIDRANFPLWLALPDWISVGIFYAALGLIWAAGDLVALWNLRRMGLERALQEKRVIERTVPEPDWIEDAEPGVWRISRRRLQRLTALFFVVMWTVFFALLQLVGIENQQSALDCALLAIVPAAIFTLIYAFATQHPSLAHLHQADNPISSELLKNIAWPEVARVEEVRTWNFSNSLAQCELSFYGFDGENLGELNIPPYKADATFERVRARLTGNLSSA